MTKSEFLAALLHEYIPCSPLFSCMHVEKLRGAQKCIYTQVVTSATAKLYIIIIHASNNKNYSIIDSLVPRPLLAFLVKCRTAI